MTWSFSSVRAYKHDYCTAKTRVIFLESLRKTRASCDETDDVRCCCVTIGAAPARWVDLCRDRKDRTIGIIPIDSWILAFTSKLADSQFVACPEYQDWRGCSAGWADSEQGACGGSFVGHVIPRQHEEGLRSEGADYLWLADDVARGCLRYD